MGLFGNLFDFDNDGKTDGFEEAIGLSFIFASAEEEEKQRVFEDDSDEDDIEEKNDRLESLQEELEEEPF